jgi:hypothetical protein
MTTSDKTYPDDPNLVSAYGIKKRYPRCDYYQIRDLIEAGELGPVTQHRRGRYVNIQAVDKWIEANEETMKKTSAPRPRKRRSAYQPPTNEVLYPTTDGRVNRDVTWPLTHSVAAVLIKSGVASPGPRDLEELHMLLQRWVNRVSKGLQ